MYDIGEGNGDVPSAFLHHLVEVQRWVGFEITVLGWQCESGAGDTGRCWGARKF